MIPVDLTAYRPSRAHRDRIRASGFDLDDPDRRHPTRSDRAERLVTGRAPSLTDRAAALVKGRGRGLVDRWLQRSVLALLASSAADRAYAATLSDPDILIISVPKLILSLQFGIFGAILGLCWWLCEAMKPPLYRTPRRIEPEPPVAPLQRPTPPAPETAPTNAQTPPPAPATTRLLLDCATRTGKVRKENQDAVCVGTLTKDTGYLVVCDGVGGQPGGCAAARLAVETIARHLEATDIFSASVCEEAIKEARTVFAKRRIQGLTTAIVAAITGEWIHFATLSDGALTLIHADGMAQHLLAPHHGIDAPSNMITAFIGAERRGEARIGSVRAEPGALLLAMSDGAADLLPVEDLARRRDAVLTLLGDAGSDVAERLLIDLEEARDEESGAYLHSDNMTLAIAGIAPREVVDA